MSHCIIALREAIFRHLVILLLIFSSLWRSSMNTLSIFLSPTLDLLFPRISETYNRRNVECEYHTLCCITQHVHELKHINDWIFSYEAYWFVHEIVGPPKCKLFVSLARTNRLWMAETLQAQLWALPTMQECNRRVTTSKNIVKHSSPWNFQWRIGSCI